MMRTSSLLRWANNTKNGNNKSNTKNWIHTPEQLVHGHIAYLVKFLGNTDVEQPKGIEVVKEGIRKLRFSQQLRKAEGQRTQKVELTVSVDGVAIQEPKGKRILHQYPLHRISYCADDKAEKKFFSFIAKEPDSEKHTCFVFVSDKLAEEITLTIGQAFDLAYRRFLESTGRELEGRRQMSQLQDNVATLERQNQVYRRRLVELSALVETNRLRDFFENQGISSILELASETENGTINNGALNNGNHGINSVSDGALINLNANDPPTLNQRNDLLASLPPVPPRSFESKKVTADATIEKKTVIESDDDFDPRSDDSTIINNNRHIETSSIAFMSPPPTQQKCVQETTNGTSSKPMDIFGAEPFGKNLTDLFGMDDFGRIVSTRSPSEPTTSTSFLDQRISEMQEGFSRGLSFGGDDFILESLDPLRP